MAEGKPKTMIRVFLILILDLIAFTVILPLLPSILDHYEAGSKDGNHDSLLISTHKLMNWAKEKLNIPNITKYNNVLIGGFLGSLFSLLQFVANPVFGCLSDISGRRKALIISLLGTAFSYLVWLKSDSFTVFLVSRVIGGLTKGSVTICTSIMSDITTKENRGKGMAMIGIAFAIGFTIGPSFGAYFVMKQQQQLSSLTTQPFYRAAMFSLVLQLLDVLLVILILDETKTVTGHVSLKARLSSAMELANPCNLLKSCFMKASDPALSMKSQLTLIHFVYLLLFSGLEFTLTFLTHQRFSFTSKQQGILFLYIGLVMMVVQGGCTRRVKLGSEKRLTIMGIFSVILSMFVVAFSSSIFLLYVGLFLYSFGAATVIPCLTTMFSHHSSDSESGEMVGVFRSAGALARAIGPAITCFLYWTFGSTICYCIGGFLFLIPLFMSSNLEVKDKQI